MASSAKDIPSTAYKPQAVVQGLDPATVIRPGRFDSGSSETGAGATPQPSALGILFPEQGRTQQTQLPEGLQLGDFVIESRIGAGGMGAVFRARDQKLDRSVALKILSPSQTHDPSSIKRFQNEARAAARLDHDNIARIYTIGEDQGLHYIAFEYVEGITVRELIRQRGVVDPHETINFMLQISVALKHTAAAGVVHRDIKPSNLILTPQGRAKLVDWGLARKERLDEHSNDLTVSGTTLGTFDYISPEQARDPRNVDVRSDIYSLGCTAYHMLTGSPPYAEGTVLQKLLDHQGKMAPDPRDRNPNVPRELSRIVKKMMASDPEDRYWSPQALTHDLLLLASETGLRAVHPDGLTWRNGQEETGSRVPQGLFWWWLGAFALACVVAILSDRWAASRSVSNVGPLHPGLENTSEEMETEEAMVASIGTSVPNLPRKNAAQRGEYPLSLNPGNLKESRLIEPFSQEDPFDFVTRFPPPISAGIFQTKAANPWSSEELLESWGDETDSPEREPGTIAIAVPNELKPGTVTQAHALEKVIPAKPPAGTAIPPVAKTAERQTTAFRILALNGEFIQSTEDLESAIQVVPDGGTIEYQTSQMQTSVLKLKQIRLVDKAITIRPATNSQMVLRFDVPTQASETRGSDFIVIKGGALNLVNLHVQVMAAAGASSQPWSLFTLEGAGRLRCRQSTFTIESQQKTLASFVKINRSALQTVDSMNLDSLDEEVPRRIQFDDCVLRGTADLLLSETSEATSLELNRTMVTISGALLHYQGDNNTRNLIDEFDIRLSRVAGVANGGLLKIDLGMTIARQPTELYVRCEDSILIGQQGKPLIHCLAGMENRTLQNLIHWDGEHNLYAGWPHFMEIRGLTNPDSATTALDFEAWSQSSGQIRELGARQLQATSPPGAAVRADQWTAQKFLALLKAESSDNLITPDLADYGPDFFELPVPPSLIDAPASSVLP